MDAYCDSSRQALVGLRQKRLRIVAVRKADGRALQLDSQFLPVADRQALHDQFPDLGFQRVRRGPGLPGQQAWQNSLQKEAERREARHAVVPSAVRRKF
ncbi:hypothetical protein ACFSHR_01720 [Azotobacter chroococcum]